MSSAGKSMEVRRVPSPVRVPVEVESAAVEVRRVPAVEPEPGPERAVDATAGRYVPGRVGWPSVGIVVTAVIVAWIISRVIM